MSFTTTIVANPGVTSKTNIPTLSKVQVIDIGNGTPFDLTYQGFGCPDSMIIEAGTKVRLYHEVLDTGTCIITPVNNVGVTGTGIINLTAYYIAETVPQGTFPITIPAQIVQAKVSGVQTLSNEGAAVGTEVIDIGDVNFTKLIDIFNDGHGVWSVDQSNVKHQVLLWSTSGNPLIIGASGDTVPFNGAVTIAQTLGVTGVSTFTGNTIANGGMNNNTFRDNTVGNTQITLSNTSPQVSVANDLAVAGIIQANKTANSTVNGSVAGSVSFFTPIWGTGLKILIVQVNGWNSASVATFTLPSGITWGMALGSYGSGATQTWGLFIGGTAQPQRHILTLGAAGAAGTDEAITALKSDNFNAFALTGGAATSVQVGTTGGSVITGIIIVMGN